MFSYRMATQWRKKHANVLKTPKIIFLIEPKFKIKEVFKLFKDLLSFPFFSFLESLWRYIYEGIKKKKK